MLILWLIEAYLLIGVLFAGYAAFIALNIQSTSQEDLESGDKELQHEIEMVSFSYGPIWIVWMFLFIMVAWLPLFLRIRPKKT